MTKTNPKPNPAADSSLASEKRAPSTYDLFSSFLDSMGLTVEWPEGFATAADVKDVVNNFKAGKKEHLKRIKKAIATANRN